jgi:hypothetical protein
MKIWLGAFRSFGLYIIYFLLSFAISTPFLFKRYKSDAIPVGRDSMSNPAVCKKVSRVSACDHIITVSYNGKIPRGSPTFIAKHFGLDTSWLTSVIFFPYGSGEVTLINTTSISIEFYFPVVARYRTTLFCGVPVGDEYAYDSIIRNFSVSINVTDFVPSESYSQLKCHHTDVFALRWCEFTNLAYFDRHFVQFSPAKFAFPHPFLVPGPRAPPFDKTETQLRGDPIVVQFGMAAVPRQLEIVSDFCYIYGVFHNYYMLWHTIFDFMVPLHNFMRLLNRPETRDQRRVYVRSDGVWIYGDLMKSFSYFPITIIDEENPMILMQRGTLGIEKLESMSDVVLHRNYDDSIKFHYNINRSTAVGLREDILSVLEIPDGVIGKNGKPLALLIDRGSNARNIANMDEVRDAMIEGCPQCFVDVVQLHDMDVRQQVELVSTASVLVGFHGSGLAHVIWMAESSPSHTTHLLEVLPYKYICRDWYQTAAAAAGVKYHMMMNRSPPTNQTKLGWGMDQCWNRPEQCATLGCHDRLRDQPTTVELDTFAEVWKRIADDLKTTVVTSENSM